MISILSLIYKKIFFFSLRLFTYFCLVFVSLTGHSFVAAESNIQALQGQFQRELETLTSDMGVKTLSPEKLITETDQLEANQSDSISLKMSAPVRKNISEKTAPEVQLPEKTGRFQRRVRQR